MTTRAEHLEWAKERALAYLPDAPAAITSFSSDLQKHDELAGHPVREIMVMHAFSGLLDEQNCRDLIEGTR